MTGLATVGGAAVPPTGEDAPWEQHRRELTAYCYRMLGSSADAEDAVQDTMVRAWKGFDRFEGRSALRSWLYRIATNVCLTMLEGRNRRARPMDMGPAGSANGGLPAPLPDSVWVEPVPDERVVPTAGDPADVAVSRESVRLAFVAALQHLPPRQRVVLILREVLQWRAAEVAELLDTTVASVNSALQRARASLAEHDLTESPGSAAEMDQAHADLLDRYADAFQRYDMTALVALLHEDVVMSMPPLPLWLRGADEFLAWMTGTGKECEGSRLVPVAANGQAGFAQYRRDPDGGYFGWAVQVLEIHEGKITGLNSFLDVATLFPMWGLALRLDEHGEPVTS